MPTPMPPDKLQMKTREYYARVQEAKIYLNNLAADLEDDSFIKVADCVYHALDILEGIGKDDFTRS